MNETIAAIVLAAGKGTRLGMTDKNKVVLPVGGKPMILHTLSLIKSLGITTTVVVVGFAKESVMKILGDEVVYVTQKEQIGSADTVRWGLTKIPENIHHVLILNGDDSGFYPKQLIEELIALHFQKQAAFTFLTLQINNPHGLGRVIRDDDGKVESIVEEYEATPEEKNIREINPGCYVASVAFLKKYLPLVQKSRVKQEYYLVDLVRIAKEHNEILESLEGKNIQWRGVNTKEELDAAQNMIQ